MHNELDRILQYEQPSTTRSHFDLLLQSSEVSVLLGFLSSATHFLHASHDFCRPPGRIEVRETLLLELRGAKWEPPISFTSTSAARMLLDTHEAIFK